MGEPPGDGHQNKHLAVGNKWEDKEVPDRRHSRCSKEAQWQKQHGFGMWHQMQFWREAKKGILSTHVKSQILVHSNYMALGMPFTAKTNCLGCHYRSLWEGGWDGTAPGKTAPLSGDTRAFSLPFPLQVEIHQLTNPEGRQKVGESFLKAFCEYWEAASLCGLRDPEKVW